MTNKRLILLSIIMLTASLLEAQQTKRIKQMADADSARLVGIFKDIHQNP